MMNFAAINLPVMDSVQAITLGQPMLDRPCIAWHHCHSRPIVAAKFGRVSITPGGVANASVTFLGIHLRIKIRQMIEAASRPDGRTVGRVEAEEIDSWL